MPALNPKDAIIKNFPAWAERLSLEPIEDILDAEDFFSPVEIGYIQTRASNHEKNVQFLLILLNKEMDSVSRFIALLKETGQEHLLVFFEDAVDCYAMLQREKNWMSAICPDFLKVIAIIASLLQIEEPAVAEFDESERLIFIEGSLLIKEVIRRKWIASTSTQEERVLPFLRWFQRSATVTVMRAGDAITTDRRDPSFLGQACRLFNEVRERFKTGELIELLIELLEKMGALEKHRVFLSEIRTRALSIPTKPLGPTTEDVQRLKEYLRQEGLEGKVNRKILLPHFVSCWLSTWRSSSNLDASLGGFSEDFERRLLQLVEHAKNDNGAPDEENAVNASYKTLWMALRETGQLRTLLQGPLKLPNEDDFKIRSTFMECGYDLIHLMFQKGVLSLLDYGELIKTDSSGRVSRIKSLIINDPALFPLLITCLQETCQMRLCRLLTCRDDDFMAAGFCSNFLNKIASLNEKEFNNYEPFLEKLHKRRVITFWEKSAMRRQEPGDRMRAFSRMIPHLGSTQIIDLCQVLEQTDNLDILQLLMTEDIRDNENLTKIAMMAGYYYCDSSKGDNPSIRGVFCIDQLLNKILLYVLGRGGPETSENAELPTAADANTEELTEAEVEEKRKEAEAEAEEKRIQQEKVRQERRLLIDSQFRCFDRKLKKTCQIVANKLELEAAGLERLSSPVSTFFPSHVVKQSSEHDESSEGVFKISTVPTMKG